MGPLHRDHQTFYVKVFIYYQQVINKEHSRTHINKGLGGFGSSRNKLYLCGQNTTRTQEHMENTVHRSFRVPVSLDKEISKMEGYKWLKDKYFAVLRRGLDLPAEHSENTHEQWDERFESLEKMLTSILQRSLSSSLATQNTREHTAPLISEDIVTQSVTQTVDLSEVLSEMALIKEGMTQLNNNVVKMPSKINPDVSPVIKRVEEIAAELSTLITNISIPEDIPVEKQTVVPKVSTAKPDTDFALEVRKKVLANDSLPKLPEVFKDTRKLVPDNDDPHDDTELV